MSIQHCSAGVNNDASPGHEISQEAVLPDHKFIRTEKNIQPIPLLYDVVIIVSSCQGNDIIRYKHIQLKNVTQYPTFGKVMSYYWSGLFSSISRWLFNVRWSIRQCQNSHCASGNEAYIYIYIYIYSRTCVITSNIPRKLKKLIVFMRHNFAKVPYSESSGFRWFRLRHKGWIWMA